MHHGVPESAIVDYYELSTKLEQALNPLMNDYNTVTADEFLEDDLRAIVRLSIAEDLRRAVDWTTVCLIEPDRHGGCEIVPRKSGVCAGLVTSPGSLMNSTQICRLNCF